MQKKELNINDRLIGDGHPVFIIAEAGANFKISKNIDLNYRQALKLIDIAANAKADAIKFQLYKAKKLYVKNAGNAGYISKEKSIYDIIKDIELPYEWISKLKKYCDNKEIMFLCTPFDEESVDELEKIGIAAYKIASYSITHIPLIKYVAKKGKPIILSTGASNVEDIRNAIKTIKNEGNDKIIIMQCTAKYPAPLLTINLKILPYLIKEFNMIVGLSDHSREPLIAPLGATALGAKIIEKHFTENNNLQGPDHCFAVLPEELKEIVDSIRKLEIAMGSSEKKVQDVEKELYNFARRFIYVIKDIKKGDFFSKENISVLRSGNAKKGLNPKYFDEILGEKSITNLKKGDALESENFDKKIGMDFRPVDKNDCKFLFELRNDPIVRVNSIHSEKIEFSKHEKWFFKSLNNPDRRIFIIVLENESIGQLRFDKQTNSNSAEISIALHVDYRGKGLGSKILRKGCKFAFSNLGYNSIIAKIKKENIASIKSFKKVGFLDKYEKENILIMELMK